jgi:hypothetical protein
MRTRDIFKFAITLSVFTVYTFFGYPTAWRHPLTAFAESPAEGGVTSTQNIPDAAASSSASMEPTTSTSTSDLIQNPTSTPGTPPTLFDAIATSTSISTSTEISLLSENATSAADLIPIPPVASTPIIDIQNPVDVQPIVDVTPIITEQIVPEPPPKITKAAQKQSLGIQGFAMNQNKKTDPNAKQSCATDEPFTDISSTGTNNLLLLLVPGDPLNAEELEVGSLPYGIDIRFVGNQSYKYNPSTGETTIHLQIRKEAYSTQKGKFTIPILYTETGATESTTVCQINVINY